MIIIINRILFPFVALTFFLLPTTTFPLCLMCVFVCLFDFFISYTCGFTNTHAHTLSLSQSFSPWQISFCFISFSDSPDNIINYKFSSFLYHKLCVVIEVCFTFCCECKFAVSYSFIFIPWMSSNFNVLAHLTKRVFFTFKQKKRRETTEESPFRIQNNWFPYLFFLVFALG